MCECSVVKHLPQFMHEFTVFEPVENTVNDISRPAQQARLDQVRAKDITQLLGNDGRQISNKELEGVVKELSQQKKEETEKEEKSPIKYMKTSDLQYSFLAMETLTDGHCDTDHDWEQSMKVKSV